ncbi:hypothetical protein [uncultured Alistipes sp.]|uniref:hypothetical protein n=1 Tax=uncultured Alistipes sp. TaxID=538949 RepID=UPI00272C16D0|nr:hypothetical protein [uncultured Alistipes sp.]
MIRINICLWFQASKLPFFEEKTKTRHTLFQNSGSEKRKKRGESGPAGPGKHIAEHPGPGQTTGHAPFRRCRRRPPRTPADRTNNASDSTSNGTPGKNRTSHPADRETGISARRPVGKTARTDNRTRQNPPQTAAKYNKTYRRHKIIGRNVGRPENIRLLCIPEQPEIRSSYFVPKFAM